MASLRTSVLMALASPLHNTAEHSSTTVTAMTSLAWTATVTPVPPANVFVLHLNRWCVLMGLVALTTSSVQVRSLPVTISLLRSCAGTTRAKPDPSIVSPARMLPTRALSLRAFSMDPVTWLWVPTALSVATPMMTVCVTMVHASPTIKPLALSCPVVRLAFLTAVGMGPVLTPRPANALPRNHAP